MQPCRKVILFGGSFDPIHSGHLRVARHAQEELGADELIFIPVRRSPHKTDFPVPGHHRYAMISKAIEGIDGFSVSDCELKRPDPSYSLASIHFFREQFGPNAVLYWLIGADQLSDFDKWYRVQDLVRLCRVSVMVRAGYPPPDFSRFKNIFSEAIIEQLKNDAVQTPLIDLSSTTIRHQLSSASVPPDALPPGVFKYIIEHQLYGYPQ